MQLATMPCAALAAKAASGCKARRLVAACRFDWTLGGRYLREEPDEDVGATATRRSQPRSPCLESVVVVASHVLPCVMARRTRSYIHVLKPKARVAREYTRLHVPCYVQAAKRLASACAARCGRIREMTQCPSTRRRSRLEEARSAAQNAWRNASWKIPLDVRVYSQPTISRAALDARRGRRAPVAQQRASRSRPRAAAGAATGSYPKLPRQPRPRSPAAARVRRAAPRSALVASSSAATSTLDLELARTSTWRF